MSDLDRNIYKLICNYLSSADWESVEDQRVWDINRVSEHTGYSRRYLYNQISSGKLKSLKHMGNIYIPYFQVKNLLLQSKKIDSVA